MVYNTTYTCGNMPLSFKTGFGLVENKFTGNGREYLITMNTDSSGLVTLKCISNDLPGTGKPMISATFAYV